MLRFNLRPRTRNEFYIKSYRVLMFDELSDYEYTIQNLVKSSDINQNSHSLNNLGLAYFEIGDYKNAQIYFTEAIRKNDKNDIAFVNRAELNLKSNRNLEAIEDYNHALKLNPKNATYWRCRAHLFKKLERIKDAISDLKKAYKLEPEFEYTKKEIIELENSLGIKPKLNWFQKLFKK